MIERDAIGSLKRDASVPTPLPPGPALKQTNIQPTIIMDVASLDKRVVDWFGKLVVDVETYRSHPRDGKLLGVALCPVECPHKPVYVPVQWYNYTTSTWCMSPEWDSLKDYLAGIFHSRSLVGHSYSYDKLWVDEVFGTESSWHACTRLMWHMASAPSGPRPYGLKDAQVEVLGWDARGDSELEEQVRARGGSLGKGDHYLADLETLSKYACYDAASTACLYNKLSGFFDKNEYWWMLDKMVEYSWLLQQNTEAGVRVDVQRLQEQIQILADTKGAYGARFIELCASRIARLEAHWREDRAAKYVSPGARERFLRTYDLQKKFSISSDKDKRELFYDTMALPMVMETEGGKPSTSQDAIACAIRQSGKNLTELLEAYTQSEGAETLVNGFAKPWLGGVRDGRLHPKFNPCGTVSYRLSGFKPYLLNAPFDEKELMGVLQCDEGWEGVHADFASVEPCVTAHYSQDPSLLKVFKDGQGDVYLDLALTLFPGDDSLKAGYNSKAPVTNAIKELFKRQRKIAKIIQLAVQYTGTKYTVKNNLDIAGFPTTLAEADALVKAYWRHFKHVKVMNEALFRRYAAGGNMLRNVAGRIIRVPNPRYKDLPNRFIQSSAHDLLSLWVLKISSRSHDLNLSARPVLLDCHDSTSWQAPKDQISALEEIFKETLTELNEEVRMTVPVKIEMKRFTTLAGLKGDG